MKPFSSISSNQRDKLLLSLVCFFTLIHFLFRLLWRTPTGMPYDAYTYYQGAALLANGSFDIFRTPGYPLFLSLAVKLLGFNNYYLVCSVQGILLLLSVPALWYICRRSGLNLFWRFAVTMLYGPLSTLDVIYSLYILTDAPNLYLTVIWAAAVFSIAQRVRIIPALGVILLPLLCISIRPFALYLLIVAAIISVLWFRGKNMRNAAWIMVIAIALSGFSALLHSTRVYQNSGVFSTSVVSKYNDFLYISLYYPEEDLEEYPWMHRCKTFWLSPDSISISKDREFWRCTREDFHYVRDETDRFANEHPYNWLKTRYYSGRLVFHDAGPFFFINGWIFPLLAILASACFIWLLFSSSTPAWVLAWNWLMYMGPMGLVVTSAPADWARLLMPGMPFVYILLCLTLQRLCASKSKE